MLPRQPPLSDGPTEVVDMLGDDRSTLVGYPERLSSDRRQVSYPAARGTAPPPSAELTTPEVTAPDGTTPSATAPRLTAQAAAELNPDATGSITIRRHAVKASRSWRHLQGGAELAGSPGPVATAASQPTTMLAAPRPMFRPRLPWGSHLRGGTRVPLSLWERCADWLLGRAGGPGLAAR